MFDAVLSESVMSERRNILITGGTSGLGLELVRHFLEKGYFVFTTGRREIAVSGYEDRLSFYRADFCDLGQTADITLHSCADIIPRNLLTGKYSFSALIPVFLVPSFTELSPECSG